MSVPEFNHFDNSIFGSPSLASLLEDNDFSTDILVNLATDIAKANMEVIIREKNEVKLSLGKLLLALLQAASTDGPPNEVSGQRYTAGVIYIAREKERLEEVAKVFLDFMLYPIRAFRVYTTPLPSSNVTPTEADMRNAVLWKQLMIREDRRCAVFRNHVDLYHPPASKTDKDDSMFVLGGCHIIPFCLDSLTEDQVRDTVNTWTLIKNWTNCDIRDLITDGINDPSNAMLVGRSVHALFAEFQMHFIAVDGEPDAYRLCSYYRDATQRHIVRFVSRQNIPVPSPRLIKIHAAFAQVLYDSGVGQYFEKLFEEYEEAGVLPEDGSEPLSESEIYDFGASVLRFALKAPSAR